MVHKNNNNNNNDKELDANFESSIIFSSLDDLYQNIMQIINLDEDDYIDIVNNIYNNFINKCKLEIPDILLKEKIIDSDCKIISLPEKGSPVFMRYRAF